MKVKVHANHRDVTRRLSYIHFTNKAGVVQPLPAYFEKNAPQPEVNSEVEVMITNALFNKNEHGYLKYDQPKCFFIEMPVYGKHRPVEHDGFECGQGAITLAKARIDVDGVVEKAYITPGLMQMFLKVADNVDRHAERKPLVPGKGWVEVNPNNMRWRLVGVSSVEELDL